jgi:hypothetical protein
MYQKADRSLLLTGEFSDEQIVPKVTRTNDRTARLFPTAKPGFSTPGRAEVEGQEYYTFRCIRSP